MIKIKKFVSLSIALFVLLSCGSNKKMQSTQIDANWKQCVSVDTSSKIIFFDEFSNNNNDWQLTDNDKFQVDLKNRTLHIKKHYTNFQNQGCLWLVKAIRGFNTNQDFQISFDAKYLHCKDSYNPIDLQWGKIHDDSYQLCVAIDGQILLRRYTANKSPKWIPVASITIPNLLNKDYSNKIIIRQVEDSCIICINGIEAINTKVERVPGNFIGIQECWKVDWEMDNIQVRQ